MDSFGSVGCSFAQRMVWKNGERDRIQDLYGKALLSIYFTEAV